MQCKGDGGMAELSSRLTSLSSQSSVDLQLPGPVEAEAPVAAARSRSRGSAAPEPSREVGVRNIINRRCRCVR